MSLLPPGVLINYLHRQITRQPLAVPGSGGGATAVVAAAGIGRLPGFLFLSPIPFAGRQAGLLLMTRIF